MMRLKFYLCKDTSNSAMQEIFTKKSKSLSIQFAFVVGWLLLLFFLNSLNNPAAKTISSTPAEMRFGAAIGQFLIFILPVLAFVLIFRAERLSFLTLTKKIHPLWLLSAIFLIFFSLPLIAWLGEINSAIKIPASFSGLENWMKEKEIEVGKSTELLLGDKSVGGIVFNFLIIAFLAAFSEELFFRGMIQKILIQAKLNYHIAIWITGIIFSAVHLQFYGFIPRMVLGASIGYLFYFTGSLWISIIAHFINNALYIVVALASENVKVNPLEQGQENFDWPIVALSAMLMLGVFIFLRRITQKQDSYDS